ncbi:MAG TPA: polysaccharide deacetylase family protein [Candidatus Angelobacter sp.]
MRSIAQLLGHSSSSKLLIIHTDDLGMCHSVNAATFAAFEVGAVSSASVMVPCAWFPEAAQWVVQHPQYDIGIHSTLISEWKTFKWGPISKKIHTANLTDEVGHFWPRNGLLRATPQEIEEEIFAQMILAKQAGINPSHLDSHMLSVARPEYIGSYMKVARQFGLPFLIDEHWHAYSSPDDPATATDIIVNGLFQAGPQVSPDSLEDYYFSVLRELQPGLNQLIVHVGFDDAELQAIMQDQQAYGAAWRQRDFEIVMNEKFKAALREHDIQIVNWGMLKPLVQSARHEAQVL